MTALISCHLFLYLLQNKFNSLDPVECNVILLINYNITAVNRYIAVTAENGYI